MNTTKKAVFKVDYLFFTQSAARNKVALNSDFYESSAESSPRRMSFVKKT